jgi:hypothetical protein
VVFAIDSYIGTKRPAHNLQRVQMEMVLIIAKPTEIWSIIGFI